MRMSRRGNMKWIFFLILVPIVTTNIQNDCNVNSVATGTERKLRKDYQYYYQSDWYIDEVIYAYQVICKNTYMEIGIPLQTYIDKNIFSNFDVNSTILINITNSEVPRVQVGVLNSFISLKTLYMESIGIQKLIPGSLSGLIHLEELFLRNNSILSIDLGTLNGLSSLKSLYLDYNNISKFETDTLNGLFKLENLYVSHNNISNINENTFAALALLTTIDLSYNKIYRLEANLFSKNEKLIYLNLNMNLIQILPSGLYNELRGKVFLNSNNLSIINKLSEGITHLELSNNHITVVPSNVFKNAANLDVLVLSKNKMATIHIDAFIGLTYLTNLQLDHNQIKSIATGSFQHVISLENLDLSYNEIEHLDYGLFTGLQQLETLNLSHNKIKIIDVGIFYPLRSISTIMLDGNLLRVFDAVQLISHLSTLTSISLDNNQIDCHWLTNCIHLLKKFNVSVKSGESLIVSNVHGISCITNTTLATTTSKTFSVSREIKQFINTTLAPVPLETSKQKIFLQTTPKNVEADYEDDLTVRPENVQTDLPEMTTTEVLTRNTNFKQLSTITSNLKTHMPNTISPEVTKISTKEKILEEKSNIRENLSYLQQEENKLNQKISSMHNVLVIGIMLLVILTIFKLVSCYKHLKLTREQKKSEQEKIINSSSCALELNELCD